MSSLGMQILYHRINSISPKVAAERVFLPEEDAAARMRTEGIPLPTLETWTPVRDCDLLGISLSYEMALPGMLELLDLGGVPHHGRQRGEKDPIVLVGGPVAYNPEPFADFIDLAVLGDGEQVVTEISEVMLKAKRQGWPRAKRLAELETLHGVYRPSSHHVVEGPEGRLFVEHDPKEPLVTGRTVPELLREYYPERPLLPMSETVFDRLTVEVMRGCTRGCRFCQAGSLYRPVRERDPDEIVEQAVAALEATGYEELSLASLSTSDYSGLSRLIDGLADALRGRGISLSFPSLRPDSFTPEMAVAFAGGRKGSLTFAPEAGTQRLRDIINKNSREEDLLRASELAYSVGYSGIKLYFMIGLPGERLEDLDGIFELSRKVAATRAKQGQRVTVSVSPFAPKAHTPYQRFTQNTAEQYREKLDYLRGKFRKSGMKYTGHNPESAILESAIARGDRRLGNVIERVWRSGAVLEAWNDRFDPERWHQAYRDEGLSPRLFVDGFAGGVRLPWGHLSKGITEQFFKKEWTRSERAVTAPDCREGKCDACGLMKYIPGGAKVCNSYRQTAVPSPRPGVEEKPSGDYGMTLRIRYRRGEPLRWTGHLDMVRLWDRLLRRARLPITYSQGYHPHPRLGFAPPLPVGLVSEDEYIDIDLTESFTAEEAFERIFHTAPDGLEPLSAVAMSSRPDSLASRIERIDYGFRPDPEDGFVEQLDTFLSSDRWPVERVKKGKYRTVDLRSFVHSVRRENSGEWILQMNVRDGATARLDELARVWGLGEWLGPHARRLGMFLKHEGRWTDPMAFGSGMLSQIERVPR
jgi:radical SAM family uncharacterized protein/radical SAM-linked protein